MIVVARRRFATARVLLVVLLGALPLLLGTAPATAQSASAACPYTACVATTTTMTLPAKVRGKAGVTIRVRVTVPGSTVVPQGTVLVNLYRGGSLRYHFQAPYAGGEPGIVFPRLHKGRYAVTATFAPAIGTVFSSSNATATLKVKGKHHRHH